MKVKNIAAEVNKISPLELAQDWDNVGLLIGSSEADVKNILITIDITREVLEEAKKLNTDLILSYHPVIWDGLKKITKEGQTEVIYNLIRSGISVFSIHTSFDTVFGGVNDGLAQIIGIKNPKPIGDYVNTPTENKYKLVVFIPKDHVNKVSKAILDSGAGAIGNYSNCSFTSQGTGTFKPLTGAKPAIGSIGKTEKVQEVRFETIVPASKMENVISAIKNSHPYEEPAYDVIKLTSSFSPMGLGRMGELEKPATVAQLIEKIKKFTNTKAVGIVGPEKRTVKKAAVCAGSCGKIITSVMAANCDLYLTGELKHHQALAAQQANLTCLCLSHTVSERFMLKNLATLLRKRLKNVKINVSKKDADPFKWKNI